MYQWLRWYLVLQSGFLLFSSVMYTFSTPDAEKGFTRVALSPVLIGFLYIGEVVKENSK